MRRLLSLDYIIERPTLGWLPTEADKVQRFEAFGIDRGTLPYRKYGKADKAQPRYFALKLGLGEQWNRKYGRRLDLGPPE